MLNPKLLIALGIALVLAGLLWQYGVKFLPFGRLPGDIVVDRPNFKFYMPLGTSLVLSVLLSLVMWLARKL
jgi:hypothetical protein